MTDSAQTFRIDQVRLWCWAAVIHSAFTILVLGCVVLAGREVNWLYLALFAFVPALIWIVHGLTFRVTVSPEGLEWTTADGEREFAKWDEIEGARPSRFLLFPLVELELTRGRRSGFPLILSDLSGFGDAILQHAGAEHPVSRAITGDNEPRP